jgi:hypothetical protein
MKTLFQLYLPAFVSYVLVLVATIYIIGYLSLVNPGLVTPTTLFTWGAFFATVLFVSVVFVCPFVYLVVYYLSAKRFNYLAPNALSFYPYNVVSFLLIFSTITWYYFKITGTKSADLSSLYGATIFFGVYFLIHTLLTYLIFNPYLD